MKSAPSGQGIIRVGISNTVVPGTKKDFPPPYNIRSRLHYYSSIFNTIEVNSCFYKTPLLKTYERWAADVPNDFQFTLNLRYGQDKLVTAEKLAIELISDFKDSYHIK